MADVPRHTFVTAIEDSRRWRNISRRAGDIVISTPPKSGTTWTQGIVRSLLWPAGDAPGTRGELSPWIDMRLTPIEELVAKLNTQSHRRFLKTHSPGDCIPFDKQCFYITVYRDGRDALVSWANHRGAMQPAIVAAINDAAQRAGVAPLQPWNGDYSSLYTEWTDLGSPARHLAGWWDRRGEPNVLFVHYADLSVDLEGEMRRIADFLDLEVSASQWPKVVARCRLGAMRQEAEDQGGMDHTFVGGAASFFNKGTNGRWRNELNESILEDYHAHVRAHLSDDAAISWLEQGSRSLGQRPEQMTVPATVESSAPRDTAHPLRHLQGARPSTLDAIADRRVDEARAAGLFDNLPLHGKPIPDLDRQRPSGWWANQFVARERKKVKALQLEEEIRRSMPTLWRQSSEAQLGAHLVEINAKIAEYNNVTTLAPMPLLDQSETLATWRRLRAGD